MTDPFELERFVEAQVGVYRSAVRELTEGSKQGHWIWFIFPQILGLGLSPTSQRYAIRSLAEAEAYLAHPILGARLRECVGVVCSVLGYSAEAIFGDLDAMKFHSSMTLFACASPTEALFQLALEKYFQGSKDLRTLELL
jgi:uncharacterized protein (DUF1810 family)